LLLLNRSRYIQAVMPVHKAIRRVSTYLALIAFLFMRLASLNGAVACFGADGHIALEGAHVATSADRSNASGVLQRAQLPATQQLIPQQAHDSVCVDDGATSCMDVNVPHVQAVGVAGHHLPDIAVADLVDVDFVVPPITELSYAANFIRGPPAASSFLLHLRSVILLI
jgi:hypothetical protein